MHFERVYYVHERVLIRPRQCLYPVGAPCINLKAYAIHTATFSASQQICHIWYIYISVYIYFIKKHTYNDNAADNDNDDDQGHFASKRLVESNGLFLIVPIIIPNDPTKLFPTVTLQKRINRIVFRKFVRFICVFEK